jgi:hypothetical protein
VREAIFGVIEAEHTRLAGLAAGGAVSIAVDFVPRGPSRAPQRTLVVRATRKDLEARTAGKIAAGELRGRLETSEY